MPFYETYHASSGAALEPMGPGEQQQRPFTIAVRFLGGLTASQRSAFRGAADRWARIIVGDLSRVVIDGETIDDVLILARGEQIDGPGHVLGQAGPTHVRPAGAAKGAGLPARGRMTFDSADLAAMEANGTLLDVITHEMGHVLGVGTIWARKGLLGGIDSDNPVFTGPRTRVAYGALRGVAPRDVPVENEGGPGTRGSHWREKLFLHELMSGRIAGRGNPISAVTVASLADLGYEVDFSAAEDYSLPDVFAALESAALEVEPLVDLDAVLRIVPVELPEDALEVAQ